MMTGELCCSSYVLHVRSVTETVGLVELLADPIKTPQQLDLRGVDQPRRRLQQVACRFGETLGAHPVPPADEQLLHGHIPPAAAADQVAQPEVCGPEPPHRAEAKGEAKEYLSHPLDRCPLCANARRRAASRSYALFGAGPARDERPFGAQNATAVTAC